jgi:hypothetical protein
MEQMTIKKAHCFFEQSGTFKNAFKHYGIDAEDYDIQNNFGETDNVVDLFAEIEKGYDGKPSIFDRIEKDDLIMAFFPCIYFCEANTRLFRFEDMNHRCHTHKRAVDDMLIRSRNRQTFFELALKLFCLADTMGKRLIVENPYSTIHYLVQYFPYRAKVVDMNRRHRGDYFKKPTQYWFVNCEPSHGFTLQDDKEHKCAWDAKSATKAGLCSEERSMISPDYAKNFIDDFLLGGGHREGALQQTELFQQETEITEQNAPGRI